MPWREGRDYVATVRGDIVEGPQAATVSAQLDPLFAPLRALLLPGYRIGVAGAVEESSKGQGSIAAGAPLMLFIMFTLLMLNRPFGFVALLGVIALMGMIMRNSVILIDQIEHDRGRGGARDDPMAVAIRGGLIAATALSLPAMYAAWFRVRREPVSR